MEQDLEHIKKIAEKENITLDQALLFSLIRMKFRTNKKIEELSKKIDKLKGG